MTTTHVLSETICPTCEEAPRTFRGDLRVALLSETLAENTRLREELELLSRWIVDHGCYVTGALDHACARCIPGGSLVSKTWICARHRSEDIQAAHRVTEEPSR
ncbi:MAG TPA: hypothetical protein VM925_21770 [Labilithrix sp.]|jgi:hypothetical protein|nr:hypothetical protein [Labilithrix sp.]